ncbi:SpoIID/LytB domain-containing protein [Geomicrobium sp. JCM 19039]|uniref:SpoIID/LytB domain-containing protein n=1 Tax=Geomicrobium sp. JCM 19039 TaxID=1460636 RepID=UPI00126935DC|nr:SpoIID/LytB domain-containing protein [Geomicrobium sp. JCM 19039]
MTPAGSYRLVNLGNGQSVSYSGPLQFRYANSSGQVGVRDARSDSYIYSSRGFRLEERSPGSSSNDVTVNRVRAAGSSSYTQNTYRGTMEVTSPGSHRGLRLHNILGIDDYLKGVVPREMSGGWPLEALKAQSVAARNYAKSNMNSNDFLVDTTVHQVYVGKTGEHPNSNRAVDETRGIYATHNGSLINAFYHSSSGGYTDDSENVWLTTVPYIRAVEDPYDNNPGNSRHTWTTTMTRSDIGAHVFGNGWTVSDLEVNERSEAGRVQKLTVVGVNNNGQTRTKTFPERGGPDSIRSALGQSLNSTKFDIRFPDQDAQVRLPGGDTTSIDLNGASMALPNNEQINLHTNHLSVRTANGSQTIQPSGETITFEGGGWGHGLGMSQWGALTMAQQGYSYEDILHHYYTNIRIERR